MLNRKEFGENIRRIRLEIGFSQKAVAQALNCSRSAYSYKENGESGFNVEEIQRIAVLFGVDPALFFHPEYLPKSKRRIRPSRGTSAAVAFVGDLSPQERELICLLRANQTAAPVLKERSKY